MVVIVVSRRVGQVTLAVSERTSCRNLNGLKAMAFPRPPPDEFDCLKGIRTARKPPNPLLKDEPASGLDCSGISNSRAGYPLHTGRLQVAGMYCAGFCRSRCGLPSQNGVALASWCENARKSSWQEWQGSNLRPPVLETGALPIELHS